MEAALVDGELLHGDVTVDGGVVTGLAVGGTNAGRRGIAAPGFVDLQVNGFAGVDLMTADADGYLRAGEAMLASGTTAYQPTFITSPPEAILAALHGMPLSEAGGPRILGAHVEGPFLSPSKMGAHDPAYRRAPDLALLHQLLAAGNVRQFTLAPELPGALELIDELVARGVTVALGHTNASAAEANAAFDRGASTVVHLYNGMGSAVAGEEPGVVVAALARPDVVVQVIVDGHHVPDDKVHAAWQAAAGRLALVTDAVPAAGNGDGNGTYTLGTRSLVADNGVVRGPEGQLAGSALTMLDAVRNLHALGIPLAEALNAAAAVPADVARRPDLGRLAIGGIADIVVLDDRLEIDRVLVDGAVRVAH